MSLHYNGDNIYLFVNGNNYIGNIPNSFGDIDSKRKVNVYDFSFDYNAVDKSNILNIHNFLKVKSYIK